MGAGGVLAPVLLWEGYKLAGPENGLILGGTPAAWENWMSVAVIASYLAFFPVGWWRSFLFLRLPASVPFLLETVNPETGELYQPEDLSVIDWNEEGSTSCG